MPTEAKSDEDKDIFYAQIVSEQARISNHDIKMLMEVCNAEIRKENVHNLREKKYI